MLERWAGPSVVALILASVVAFLALNLNPRRLRPPAPAATAPPGSGNLAGNSQPGQVTSQPPAGFREYPIGDDAVKNQIRIAAVYLPPVEMEGMAGAGSSSLIHLEADIHATAGNRNGFAKNEFVPYLVVHYAIVPLASAGKGESSETIRGKMMPMVARDGLHYGASIEMPKPGRFKLTYAIDPPSAGGLGRHADSATGVDPWWKPFEVSFDWDYPGPPEAEPSQKTEGIAR